MCTFCVECSLKINITVGTTYMICILMSHSSLGPHSISLFEDIKRTLLLELQTVDISSASPRRGRRIEKKKSRKGWRSLRNMRLSHVVVLAALLSGSECTSGPTNSVPTLRRGLKTEGRSVVAQFRETEVNSRAVANTLCANAKMGRKPRPYLGSYYPLEIRSLRGGRCVHADSEEQ